MLTKAKLILVSLFGLLSMFAVQVHAALPPEATAALTELKDDGTTMIASIWPVVVAITVGFAVIKLFKRGAGRAT